MTRKLLVGFESAQAFWREVGERVAAANPTTEVQRPLLVRILFERGEGIDLSAMPRRTRVGEAPGRIEPAELDRLRSAAAYAEPLHLCVSRQAGRRYATGAVCHLMTGSYPPGSFYATDKGVLVTGPELTFLQMARQLDEDLLVAYGHELCGYYARVHVACGFVNCPQLTSVARIANYLDQLERLREERGEGRPWGLGLARHALEHIRDGAASPEEAVTSMLLTLPRNCRPRGSMRPSAWARERPSSLGSTSSCATSAGASGAPSWSSRAGSTRSAAGGHSTGARGTSSARTTGRSSRSTARCSTAWSLWTRSPSRWRVRSSYRGARRASRQQRSGCA